MIVPTAKRPDLDALRTWQSALEHQVDSLRTEIRAKQLDLSEAEERLSLVSKLIEVETRTTANGPVSRPPGMPDATPARAAVVGAAGLGLEDAVESILRTASKPLHISDIRAALIEHGVQIPGRGDDANIIVRLRRFESRFMRTARGTYALVEWGLPVMRGRQRRRAVSR